MRKTLGQKIVESTALASVLAWGYSVVYRRRLMRHPALFVRDKAAVFRDLHIHTRYSFDSFLSNQKNDPDGAYEYAKGQVITLPDAYGEQTISAQIDRPIDFAAVTDHGQLGKLRCAIAIGPKPRGGHLSA